MLPLGLHDLLEALLQLAPADDFARQEDQAAAVFLLAGQRQTGPRASLLQEGVRHLHENARAIAGVFLAAAGAAMVEIHQNLDGVLDDLVGLPALDIDQKADATGVVLEPRIVKTLLGGRAFADRLPE